jgi:hypothetical protein
MRLFLTAVLPRLEIQSKLSHNLDENKGGPERWATLLQP